mmetsp:Transcript_3829/g.11070  ORF Transcript_3829/g.11070 Transcript_3829/m.11070 type:complete len:253 (-) Transcript_3829:1798-2556(-)
MQTGETRGVVQGVCEVLRQEGARAFWKGNVANVVRSVPNKGILLSSYDTYKALLERRLGLENAAGVAGAAAGATSVVATYPLDLTRTRIAGVLGAEAGAGIAGTLALVLRTEGVRGLYRGVTPTLLGSFPYEAIKFSTFDFAQRQRPESWGADARWHALWSLGAGALGATAAHFCMYPNETLRRRLQLPGNRYRNALDCLVRVIREEGVATLYRGLGLTVLRGIPNTGLQFGIYELFKHLWRRAPASGPRLR